LVSEKNTRVKLSPQLKVPLMTRRLRLITLAVTAALSSTGAALAHGHLASATPSDKSTVVAAPSVLHLKFSEGIELKFSGVTVTGPGKESVATGPAALAAGADSSLEVPITGKMTPGTYSVEWYVLSKDGHKTKGSYTFTIKP
jgi:methionine-rich copper-binding protein CopC